jgi:hypothetical protein
VSFRCVCGRSLRPDGRPGGPVRCPGCGRVVRAGAAPPPPLHDHADGLLPHDADFFTAPPREVGPLLSADTTLRRGVGPWPAWARWTLLPALAALGWLAGAAGVRFFPSPLPLLNLLLPLVPSGAAVLLGWSLTRFRHDCSYVGRGGLARFACSGRRDRLAAEVLSFRDAAELRAAQARRYSGGRYRDTVWSFVWTDPDGRPLLELRGRHRAEAGLPRDRHDPVHFALAAEVAWTLWLLGDAQRRIDRGEAVTFRLGREHAVRLGRGFLVFVGGRGEERWAAEEIAEAGLDNGIFRVRRFGAREGWGADGGGEFRFGLGELSNARLFLRLLETAAGVPVR